MSDKLLKEIINSLQRNESVQAAWLAGSRGRGTNDEFSDIDIWVAIGDAVMPTVVDDPLLFVESMVPTVMHINAPSIAPTGGAFLGCWVPVDGVVCQVDWYFTPASLATRDHDTFMLFGDVTVRDRTSLPPLQDESIAEKANENLVMALQRINLMVKRARRGFTWGVSNAARNADRNLVTADVLLNCRAEPQFEHQEKSFLIEPVPSGVNEIQALANHLLDVVTDIVGRAGVLPVHQSAIDAMREIVRLWQESGWKPTEEYYRTLPRRRLGAGVLITDVDGRILLLETTYKDVFEIPGGVCEAGEPPREAVSRELQEELGIAPEVGRLLVFDHRSEPDPKGDAIMLVYDGGMLADPSMLVPDQQEIARGHWVPIDDVHKYCTPGMTTRLRAALEAREQNRTIEIQDDTVIG